MTRDSTHLVEIRLPRGVTVNVISCDDGRTKVQLACAIDLLERLRKALGLAIKNSYVRKRRNTQIEIR